MIKNFIDDFILDKNHLLPQRVYKITVRKPKLDITKAQKSHDTPPINFEPKAFTLSFRTKNKHYINFLDAYIR